MLQLPLELEPKRALMVSNCWDNLFLQRKAGVRRSKAPF